MSIAILASLITYLYLQWPMFTTMLVFATFASVATSIILWMLYLYYGQIENKGMAWNRSSVISKEKFDSAWDATHNSVGKKWKFMRVVAIIMLIVYTLAPNQKTIGTAVAVGAATYVTHEVVSSEVVQKFLTLVTLQANSFLDERIRKATEVVESEKAASK